VRVGNKLYVMGGYVSGYSETTRRVDIYDVTTNKWSRGADVPGAQTHAGATTDGRYIYYVAGQYGALFSRQGTNEAWRYDTKTNKWSRWANLPEVRFGGALAFHEGNLYFYGGTGADRMTSSSKAWKISTSAGSNGTWTRIADMPYASDHLGHAVVNGQIFAIGGERDHNISYIQHARVYSYRPSTNTWTRRADMPVASSHFEGAVVEHQDKIWITAGQIDSQQLTNQVRVYDPDEDKWTVHTAFPEKRKGGVAWIHNNRLHYTTGDSLDNGQPRNVVYTVLP
jgi:N-acetylneuraminic acid mutarotase